MCLCLFVQSHSSLIYVGIKAYEKSYFTVASFPLPNLTNPTKGMTDNLKSSCIYFFNVMSRSIAYLIFTITPGLCFLQ